MLRVISVLFGVVITACSPTDEDACRMVRYGSLRVSVLSPLLHGPNGTATGVHVQLIPSGSQPCATIVSHITTADGTSSFPRLAAGVTYQLHITPPDSLMLWETRPPPSSISVSAGSTDSIVVWLAYAPAATTLTFEVAAHQVDCYAPWLRKCLLVRQNGSGDFNSFSDHIEGFTFEPGYNYVLRVVRRREPQVLADASLYNYQLIEIMSKTRESQ